MADKFAVDLGAGPQAADSGSAIRDMRLAEGETESAGKQMGAAVGGAIGFAGDQGLKAWKGSLLAGEDTKINAAIQDATGKLLAVPGNAAAAQGAINSGDQSHPAGQFKSDTDRLYAAYQQGVIDKSSFQLRLDAIVKQYSDKMPGWASDFRRNAAEKVGMSGIEHMFSANAQRNEQAKADWEFSMQTDHAIMSQNGINTRDEITDQMRNAYKSHQVATASMETLNAKRSAQVMQDADNERLAAKQYGMMQATTMTGVLNDWEKFQAANKDADFSSQVVSQRWSRELGDTLQKREIEGMAQIDKWTQDQVNPITFETAKKLKDDLHTSLSNVRSNLQSAEGQNAVTLAIKNAQGKADLLQSNMKITNADLEFVKTSGMMPQMATDYMRLKGPDGNDQAFLKLYGNWGKSYIDAKNKDPELYTNLNLSTYKGETDLKTADKLHPGMGNVIIGEDNMQLRGYRGNGRLNDQQLADAEKRVTRWADNAALSGATGQANMDAVVNSGALDTVLAQLPAAKQGPLASVVRDVAGKAFDVSSARIGAIAQAGKEPMTVDNNGRIVTTSRDPNVVSAVKDYNNHMTTIQTASQYTGELGALSVGDTKEGWRNTTLDILGGKPHTGPGPTTPASIEVAAKKGTEPKTTTQGGMAAVAPKVTAQAGTPEFKTQVSALAEHEAAQAGLPKGLATKMIAAESSFKPDATSPVGAGGLTQLMPGTAKEMGVTDVNDVHQNVKGGVGYLAQQIKAHGNSVWKGLVAYNWGPGNLSEHGWRNAPEETRAYVKKILGIDPWSHK
jgi:hypothetical protein